MKKICETNFGLNMNIEAEKVRSFHIFKMEDKYHLFKGMNILAIYDDYTMALYAMISSIKLEIDNNN